MSAWYEYAGADYGIIGQIVKAWPERPLDALQICAGESGFDRFAVNSYSRELKEAVVELRAFADEQAIKRPLFAERLRAIAAKLEAGKPRLVRGPFQISDIHKDVHFTNASSLFEPSENVRAARSLYDSVGQRFSPSWSVADDLGIE